MRPFDLGPVTWPAKIASTATALLGIRGSGKSNLARVIAEEAYASKIPVVIFDPVGNWYGIRAGKNGRPDGGLPFAIFGGRHGDVPLESGSGQLIADTIVDTRLSCVIDMSHEDFSEAAKRRFLTVFVDRLFRRKQPETGWMLLILEEADDYAPQTAKGDMAACLGVFQKIVKRGRSRGLGVVLVTQRSAAINKDLLNMADTLVAFRTTASHDQKAVEGWIKYNSLSDAALASLSGLVNGEAWVWSPHELGSFDRVRFRRMNTLDTGKTPDHVEGKLARPATLADVDVPALRERMADTIERAKAEDPKELRRQLAEAKAELAKKPLMLRPGKVIEKSVLKDAHVKRLEAAVDRLRDGMAFCVKKAEEHLHMLGNRQQIVLSEAEALREIIAKVAPSTAPVVVVRPQGIRPPTAPHSSPPRSTNNGDDGLGKGERVVLIAIAQHPDGCTKEQLAVLTGYKKSSRDTFVKKLVAAGHVGKSDTGMLCATIRGRAYLGSDYAPLPTGRALADYWLGRLSGGEREVLGRAIDRFPQTLRREEIEGYQKSSRDTFCKKLLARRLITAPAPGIVRAAEMLF